MTTAGVLLAAGAGTRFAAPEHKLLATLDGRSVAARSLEALLDAGLDSVAVVTGAVDLAGALDAVGSDRHGGITLLANDHWESGIASSVVCATAWAALVGAEAVVVGLADQPFVPSAAWRAVAESSGPIAVATYGGIRGNPVRLGREVWPLLPHDGDEGARSVMRRFPEIVVPVACEGLPDDIDTVEDLRRWS
ncbi:nucleotidyltransferase family protein [Candidatus Poriferisodalis sp.]|uniref:nucleotidyltransferase family protein n=1 Tax=Candidatus Poriferisodalis sp. TaxID=3101277 RepID=UPI003AF8F659